MPRSPTIPVLELVVVHQGTFDSAERDCDRVHSNPQLCNNIGHRPIHVRIWWSITMPRTPLGLAFFLDVTVEKVCCPMGTGLKREEVGRFFETTRAAGLVASKAGGNGNRPGDGVNTR